MADKKITELPAASAVVGADLVEVVRDVSGTPVSQKATFTQVAAFTDTAGLAAHLADTVDAHDASAISFSATGTIAGTDVQTAVAEVATDAASALSTHEADTTSVHGISNTANLYVAGGTDVAVADGGTGSSTAGGARTNLGLVIGTDVQAYSAVLAATTASFLTADETKLDGIEAAADVTDAANVNTAGAVMESDYDANTILAATSDNTPAALTVAASRIVGRKATGGIDAMTAAETRTILNVEDGSTNDQTAAEILALLVTVDGAGSGLDADLLDGSSSAAFLKLVAAGAAVEDLGAVESNVNTVATTGATETLDTAVYGVHDCTMDQNCTFTFSNPAPSGKLSSFVLILRGAFTPTLPAAVDWSSGTPATYTTPSMYTFTTVDAGTTWLAAQVGKAFA